ncbi:PilX N-terminal domain-containing pilus assembly protein [Neisseria sp. CCUG12390]|uniref:pilus assembly PilX family protein n=1 Tax=Neisseria sp. CCUG12390 TaxID=3392035 RepID=UPI003A10355F
MRRSTTLTAYSLKSAQHGYSLFIVLMIMIVVALLVVTAVQSYNTEQRISTNDADRKLATSLAEVALREGENQIIDFGDNPPAFTSDCKEGRCSTTSKIWEHKCGTDLCIDKNGRKIDQANKKNTITVDGVGIISPRYVIESIGSDQDSKIYRVTAKAWGKNQNTVVMLQSYVSDE